MSKFETVKKFYTRGLWSIDRVRNAVLKGWITEEQFEELTGEIHGERALEVNSDA